MGTELNAYEAALAQLEAERDEIQLLIDGLRKRMGSSAANGSSGARRETEVADDTFFGMSVGDAARKYLGMVKKTQSTGEIAQALETGGLKHSSKDFNATIRSILLKNPDFVRVKSDWGLTEWYPGLRNKDRRAGKATFCWYNFGRKHQTLKMTPAMAAGLTDHAWSLDEIIALLDRPLSN